MFVAAPDAAGNQPDRADDQRALLETAEARGVDDR